MSKQELAQAWQRLADTLESPGFDRRAYIERLNTLAKVNGYDRTASLTEMVRAIVEDFGLRAVQSQQTTSPDVRSACYLQGKIDGLYYLTWLAKKDLRPAAPEPQPTARRLGHSCLHGCTRPSVRAGCLDRFVHPASVPSPEEQPCRSKASDYARTCTSADRKYTIMPGCGHLCT
jgi:hypothetical protein